MKTRSNDIIPNAPFKYNSSTNTFEIGTDLYVNGSIKSTDAIMLYNDTQLTFYVDKENSEDVTISPMFGYGEGITQLSFSYTLPDGAETYYAYLDLDKTSHILTDKNVFRHQLTLTSATNTYVGVIYLLDNTPITSTQLLTTHTKAFNGYIFLAVKVTGPMGAQYAIGIGYTNNTWATTDSDAITNVSDVVKPI